ncbi:hypothetical protein SCHPADRAFT_896886 [Schizopora paradoxa]|uniref:Uncharacterized protein n=1 Tax=Schizopora paradoxa TaxID=27342 RepID=A0A0H2RIE3_9AGAM|nr:hypothetical protein SCHPADRAFT_896886 [Schizopora paradoxa]
MSVSPVGVLSIMCPIAFAISISTSAYIWYRQRQAILDRRRSTDIPLSVLRGAEEMSKSSSKTAAAPMNHDNNNIFAGIGKYKYTYGVDISVLADDGNVIVVGNTLQIVNVSFATHHF